MSDKTFTEMTKEEVLSMMDQYVGNVSSALTRLFVEVACNDDGSILKTKVEKFKKLDQASMVKEILDRIVALRIEAYANRRDAETLYGAQLYQHGYDPEKIH